METQENITAMEMLNSEPKGFLDKNKPLLIVGVIVLFALAGGFWYYKQRASSPEYIVVQMLAAYSKGNAEEFEKYFDVDDFSRMLWSDYKEWRVKDKGSIWSPLRDTIDSSDAVKVAIRNVAGGKKKLEDLDKIEESNESTVSMAQLLAKLHGYTISAVSDEGDTKKFRLTAKTYDEHEFSFDLTAKQKGDYWKICELRNVGEVCTNFKNFAKESLIAYLKKVQPIQDQYQAMYQAANEMNEKYWFGFFLKSEKNPGRIRRVQESYRTQHANEAIAYVEARMNAEQYRIEELEKVETNPFNAILNSNRLSTSENYLQANSLMKQWLEAGLRGGDFFSKPCEEILQDATAAFEKGDEYDKRVRGLIKEIDYKAESFRTEGNEKPASTM